MPGIRSTLAKYDLDFLTRIARSWGVQISQRGVESARNDLTARMTEPGALQSFVNSIDVNVRDALHALALRGGRQTWAEFSRQNGEVRNFGPARRERENPDQHPVSISETLWYSGLIGRAFLGGAAEPVEYAYIPEEFLSILMPTGPEKPVPIIRPAVNQSPKFVTRPDGAFLDHLTDLLGACRMRRIVPAETFNTWGMTQPFMQLLLRSAGLIESDNQPDPEKLKSFFYANHDQALMQVFQAWMSSREINELRMLDGLIFEGNWQNDPLAPRKVLTSLLGSLETGTWWSISSLLSAIKETTPDFQRPAGDYDSWFIREENSNTYLHGFSSWDRVEGELLYLLITGPLYWMGLVNLARGNIDGKYTAFQLLTQTRSMLAGELPVTGIQENQLINLKDVRHFFIGHHAPRHLRYQVSRFCELDHVTAKGSMYTLTPASLNAAAEQGLNLVQLLQLLDKEQPGVVSEPLRQLADRWNSRGEEAGFEKVTLLRFKKEETCTEFLIAAGSRFNLEILNSRMVLIPVKNLEGVTRTLNELGILVEKDEQV